MERKKRRQSITILAIVWFFTGVEYAVILPSAWEYLQSLGTGNDFWLDFSIAMFSVATFILSPVFGKFSDGSSTKTILLVSNTFEFLGNLLYLFANDVYTVVEARFLCGVGAAAGAAIFAFVGRVSDTDADISTNMGLIMTARAVGLVVGPSFNFFLTTIDWKVGGFHITNLNSPGLLMAFIWLLCQVLCFFFFHDEPKATSATKFDFEDDEAPLINEPGEAESLINHGKIQWSEYINLGTIAVLFIQFVQLYNQTAWETVLTPMTADLFQFEQIQNSLMYMITAIVGIIVYIGLTFARRRFGQEKMQDRIMIVFGACLQLAGFILYWILPSHDRGDMWKFALGGTLFVAGMPFAYTAPALQAKLTTKRTQGLGQGIRRSVVSLAQIIGPLWASFLHIPAAFWGGMCGFTATSAIVIFLAWRRLLPRDPQATSIQNDSL